ncbi:hypothetical protein [Leadbetterella sp. DM7]|uniref:hypothetical protein n=1 Tax=Leadbetterella sp. DM7 TaxID=3235085 RepID=UPI00349EDD87
MKKFILIIICIYLILCPFYLFPSGQPQIADIFIAIASIAFLLSGNGKYFFKLKAVKYLLLFLSVVIIINSFYSFYLFAIKGIPNIMFVVPFFYIFNSLFFIIVTYTLYSSEGSYFFNWISLFIIISLSLQSILGFLGIQGGSRDMEMRRVIFFNNPNQLGYYALLMLSIFAVLPTVFRKKKFIMLLTVLLSGYLVFLSGSRAALSGIALLGIIMLIKEGFRYKFNTFILASILIFAYPVIMQSNFIKDRLDLIEQRNERNAASATQAQIRAYDRFWIHPEYIFYGSGEGEYQRFESYQKLEMHSGFGTVLFSYGLLGFFFFLSFIYTCIRRNFLYGIIILLPVLAYNVTHQGLRNSLFWVFLACLYVIFNNEIIMKLKQQI